MKNITYFASWITALAILLLVSACGGSSSSSSSPGAPPLVPPEGLSAAAGNAEVELDWDAVENADSYNVYWAPADQAIDPDNPYLGDAGWEQQVQSPHTIGGLENRRDWAFSVTTVIDDDESELSDVVVAHPAPGVTGHSIETNDETISPDSYAQVGASCGPTRIPVSGGLRVTNVDDDTRSHVHVQESWPAQIDMGGGTFQNVWTMKALNESTGDREVTAYAVCIDPPEELEIVTESVSIEAGEKTWKQISCPETASGSIRRPLGAGIQHTYSDSPDVLISGSRQLGMTSYHDTWRFNLANNSSSTRDATLYAICALPPRGFPGPGIDSFSIEKETYLIEETNACQAENNEVTLGGVFYASGIPGNSTLRLEQTYPDESAGTVERWRIGVFNEAADDRTFVLSVNCAEQDL